MKYRPRLSHAMASARAVLSAAVFFVLLAALPVWAVSAPGSDAPGHPGGTFTGSTAAQADSARGDSLALVAFYEATGGTGWRASDGWLEAPLQEWTGLTLEDGRVTRVQLPNNNLAGALPPEIRALTALRRLNLSSNALSSLPPEIGDLGQLQVLLVNENGLTSVPTEISGLTRLEELDLRKNALAALPSELGGLAQLQEMNLSENAISSLPAEIGLLTSLESLSLAENEIEELPAEIGGLDSLLTLRLAGNAISTLPPEIGDLAQLRDLDLSSNALSALPAEIGALSQLQVLLLYENALSSLPAQIGDLADLGMLNLGGNALSSVPLETWTLGELEFLGLSENALTSLPSEVGALTALQALNLAENDLEELPSAVGELPALERLYLDGNAFTFADLLPYASRDFFDLRYAPQDPVAPRDTAVSVDAGAGFELAVPGASGGEGSRYQWYRGGQPAEGNGAAETYQVESAGAEDAGRYILEVTNPSLPDLILRSAAITVNVTARLTLEPGRRPAVLGRDLLVRARLEGTPLDSAVAIVRYRSGRGPARTVPMEAAGEGLLEGRIPGAALTSEGVAYRVEVEIGGRVQRTALGSSRISLPDPGLTFEIGAGAAQVDYALISAPLDLEDPGAAAVLTDDLGAPDASRWRVFGLTGEGGTYQEGPEGLRVKPGRALWLITREEVSVSTGAGAALRLDSVQAVGLRSGWNLVANPFGFEVPLSQMRLSSGRPVKLHGYHGGWQRLSEGALRPWTGYAIRASGNDTLVIDPGAGFEVDSATTRGQTLAGRRAPPVRAAGPERYEWSVRVDARSGKRRDANNIAATHARASAGRDLLDWAEPPPPPGGGGLSVAFAAPEQLAESSSGGGASPVETKAGGSPSGRAGGVGGLAAAGALSVGALSVDVRPDSATGATWHLRVQGGSDPITLTFGNVQSVPEDLKVWLVDEAANVRQDLRRDSSYALPTALGQARSLKLAVGRGAGASDDDMLDSPPKDYALRGGVPNPFRRATTLAYELPQAGPVRLDVYDLLGRRVSRLDEGRRAAGRHEVTWAPGERFAPGMYIVRLQAGDQVLTEHVILIR